METLTTKFVTIMVTTYTLALMTVLVTYTVYRSYLGQHQSMTRHMTHTKPLYDADLYSPSDFGFDFIDPPHVRGPVSTAQHKGGTR